MSEIEKQVVKGFNIDKATEDQLNDLCTYELIDIILFYREYFHRYKQALENIQDICNVAYRYEVEELQDAFIDIIENAFDERPITSEVENE